MVELINKNVIFASELKLTGRNCLSTNEDAKDLLGEVFLIITTDIRIVSPEALYKKYTKLTKFTSAINGHRGLKKIEN